MIRFGLGVLAGVLATIYINERVLESLYLQDGSLEALERAVKKRMVRRGVQAPGYTEEILQDNLAVLEALWREHDG